MVKLSNILMVTGLLVSQSIWAKAVDVSSPDGKLQITVNDNDQVITYQVKFDGKDVVLPSKLGLLFNHRKGFNQPLSISSVDKSAQDNTWIQPWGERKQVRDHHNELALSFKTAQQHTLPISVRFRIFDDGFGFRFEGNGIDDTEIVEITNELTEFVIPQADKATAWWIPSRGWNRYEYPYSKTSLTEVVRAHTPMTFKLANGIHASIHEAALVDFAAMTLDQRRPGTLRSDLTPRSDGLKVKTQGKFVSSWRTMQVSADAVGLLNSDLILNLNEPNKLGDVSWVKPGKYLGIWWGMHLGINTWGSGEKHGATTEQTIEYLDFAAKYGFDGVLVEGWNTGWDGSWFHNGDVFSFTETYPDFDINDVAAHARKVGAKLIGHHETSGSITNYENQMQDAYAFYEKHGVSQIKTGYVADGGDIKRIDEHGNIRHEWHDSQIVINHYLKSVTEAAKYKLSINTHEPIKDTGLRRTYPNWLAREGARGQEFNAWGTPPNPPEHTVNLVYTRMLSGPMDFTPGIFNLAYEGLDAVNRVKTTLAKQLALYVVLYSPIQMAADVIEHYQQNMAAFQFIQDVPTDWEQSIALAGEVGDYAVFARQQRDGNDWFLGAITDEHARNIDINLDFLEAGKSYQAQIYQDGKNADWQTRPYELDIIKRQVKKGDKLTLKLATSGGSAIRFKMM